MMKNFEKHIDKITISLEHYNYLVNNGGIPNDMCNNICFDESWDSDKIKNWLLEEAKEEKIKVSKGEYDILRSLIKSFEGDVIFRNIIRSNYIINFLVNQCGWFKSIEPFMDESIEDIFDKVEVVSKRSLTFIKDGSYRIEGED